MLTTLALIAIATAQPTEEFAVVEGTLLVQDGVAQVDGTFEVLMCEGRDCKLDIVDGTFEFERNTSFFRDGEHKLADGWFELGRDGTIAVGELKAIIDPTYRPKDDDRIECLSIIDPTYLVAFPEGPIGFPEGPIGFPEGPIGFPEG
ncbi:MAG: hypothetical protein HN348_13490, partial [Proteobacteria bacterium]|nr:hypothetical protein [Pseudomonadota bacterium]